MQTPAITIPTSPVEPNFPIDTLRAWFRNPANRDATIAAVANTPSLSNAAGILFDIVQIRQELVKQHELNIKMIATLEKEIKDTTTVLDNMLLLLHSSGLQEVLEDAYQSSPLPIPPPSGNSQPPSSPSTESSISNSSNDTVLVPRADDQPNRPSLVPRKKVAIKKPRYYRRSTPYPHGTRENPIDLRTPSPPSTMTPPPKQRPTPCADPKLAECFTCGKSGHWASHCNKFVCKRCNSRQPGHYPKRCPTAEPEDNYDEYFDFDDDAIANMTEEPCGYY
ncbi:hypothetical protein LshimejAT787_0702140 [Lyophyllum shimeji]|uniref:CCHC-type domain-containing protein n=1 Tax=Lyophyllum shimeji TaxID=47721 RepID=A0A9P3PQI1_LYOSH|nr:hypothetical protein LshimejAT787_0702140 [Lyophyllum shimeji]